LRLTSGFASIAALLTNPAFRYVTVFILSPDSHLYVYIILKMLSSSYTVLVTKSSRMTSVAPIVPQLASALNRVFIGVFQSNDMKSLRDGCIAATKNVL
jgi:hypothetical protein